ncbi:hypothetical protein N9F58_02440, partial [Akkermansiaceae bacterium]|nr:hypothetical protein [Akkermansiaceae bacterium]
MKDSSISPFADRPGTPRIIPPSPAGIKGKVVYCSSNEVQKRIIPPSPVKITGGVRYLSGGKLAAVTASRATGADDEAPEITLPSNNGSLPADDVAAINQLGQKYQVFKSELSKVII